MTASLCSGKSCSPEHYSFLLL